MEKATKIKIFRAFNGTKNNLPAPTLRLKHTDLSHNSQNHGNHNHQ